MIRTKQTAAKRAAVIMPVMILSTRVRIFFGIFTAASFLRNVRMFLGENRFSRKADAGLFRYYTGGENTCQTPGTGHVGLSNMLDSE